jgi:hypothetical protein
VHLGFSEYCGASDIYHAYPKDCLITLQTSDNPAKVFLQLHFIEETEAQIRKDQLSTT